MQLVELLCVVGCKTVLSRTIVRLVCQVDEEEEEQPLKPSPDADTHILFVRPTSTGNDRR